MCDERLDHLQLELMTDPELRRACTPRLVCPAATDRALLQFLLVVLLELSNVAASAEETTLRESDLGQSVHFWLLWFRDIIFPLQIFLKFSLWRNS